MWLHVHFNNLLQNDHYYAITKNYGVMLTNDNTGQIS